MSSAVALSVSPFDLDYTQKSFRPLWALQSKIDDEEEVLKWCRDTIDACEQYYHSYFNLQKDNLLLFRGIQWLANDRVSNRTLDRVGVTTRRSPRIVINHLYDFVEHWVSRLTRYRPAVKIYPANASQSDADAAKVSQDVLDYIWYQNNIDKHLQELVRHAKIFGESYLWITWNPNKGDVHPDWLMAQQQGIKIPRVDASGEPIINSNGDPIFIENAMKVGDVEYRITPPWQVYDQPCRSRDKIDWSIRWDFEDIEYIKTKYPDKADQIKKDDVNEDYTGFDGSFHKFDNEIRVYECFHRSHEFMESGRYIKFTRTAILENVELPYPHKRIPYIYFNDIEVPGQIRGMSFFQQLQPITHQINACASLIYKAFVLFAHPKMVAPENSIDVNQILNESTYIFYNGGVPPNLMSSPMMPPEFYNYMGKLEQIAEKIAGTFTMSRGGAPDGVRAAKALRVLEEQEDKRAFNISVKYNEVALVDNAKMSLATMGAFADDTDGRLARILGKDNEYRVRKFKASDLSRSYDIRIQNTTALSQSPAGRIEDMMELAQIQITENSPFTKQQFVNQLDLVADEQFKDIFTQAAKCAQSENDDMEAGLTVADPTEDEDLIEHWKVHIQPVQKRQWKEALEPERKEVHKRHVYLTETLMYVKAFGLAQMTTGMPLRAPNPAFLARLQMECPNWPVYLKLPAIPGMPVAMPPGMPNMPMGDPNAVPPDAGSAAGGMMPPDALGQAPVDPGIPPGAPPMPEPPPVL